MHGGCDETVVSSFCAEGQLRGLRQSTRFSSQRILISGNIYNFLFVNMRPLTPWARLDTERLKTAVLAPPLRSLLQPQTCTNYWRSPTPGRSLRFHLLAPSLALTLLLLLLLLLLLPPSSSPTPHLTNTADERNRYVLSYLEELAKLQSEHYTHRSPTLTFSCSSSRFHASLPSSFCVSLSFFPPPHLRIVFS